jgi:cation diffusion facilitator CzcD-associated flavoprotein CzcO
MLRDSITGEETEVDAEIVIWAIGKFMSPNFPSDLHGIADFKGPLWHSAQWQHDVDLKGRRVGVIGNGCSA